MPDAEAKTQRLASAAVVGGGAVWGFYWLPVRWLDGEGVGGGWVSIAFCAVALLCSQPFLLRRDAWTQWPQQLLAGLCLGGGFALYTVALVMTDVVHAILLFYLTPVWSTLAGWLLLGQRVGLSRLIAIALGFAGMACILGPGQGLPLPRNLGDGVALASGMLWTAGSMLSFARPADRIALPLFAFALGGFLFSLAILVVAGLGGSSLVNAGNIAANLHWVIIIALTIFVPPNVFVLWAAQRIDPGRVGVLLMAEVLVGSLSAALLAADPYGPLDLLGTAFVLGAGLVEVLGRPSANSA